jgi:hypothetical protein
VTVWRAPGAAPELETMRRALPDGMKVAVDLANEAAASPNPANLDALLGQLHGLQRLALTLRRVAAQDAR